LLVDRTGGVRVDKTKTPVGVLVISIVEIVLGLLAIGLVLESQATTSDPTPVYLSTYAYASALFLAAALALLAVALLSSPARRLRQLVRANIWVASAAFVMTAGYSILAEVHTWTTPINCAGCGTVTMTNTPTVNQVVASVVLDIGGGALAALLPIVVLMLLRNRREAASAPPTAALSPPPAPPRYPEPTSSEEAHHRL
jgi:hypothetical protein